MSAARPTATLPKLVPNATWDPHFADRHPAHRVLARAAACFADASEWPQPATWRSALEAGGLAGPLVTRDGFPIVFAWSPPKSRARRKRVLVDVDAIYDERIFVRGEVPSRANGWHDLLNMLVWATFPASKLALNARQRTALRATVTAGATRLPGARTREQDALTMLDEGGLVVLAAARAAEAVTDALDRSDADALAGYVRDGTARVFAFGHTLHEHLISHAGTVRALALPLVIEEVPEHLDDSIRLADQALATALSEGGALTTPDGVASLPLGDALFG
nr:DUF3025 domain-containing protein [Deltaproteobacteria bacterium]